jgi:hypothetical protein
LSLGDGEFLGEADEVPGMSHIHLGSDPSYIELTIFFVSSDVGHCIEIFWGLDKVKWDGEARPPEEWVPKHSLEEAMKHAPPGQDTTLADPSLRHK